MCFPLTSLIHPAQAAMNNLDQINSGLLDAAKDRILMGAERKSVCQLRRQPSTRTKSPVRERICLTKRAILAGGRL